VLTLVCVCMCVYDAFPTLYRAAPLSRSSHTSHTNSTSKLNVSKHVNVRTIHGYLVISQADMVNLVFAPASRVCLCVCVCVCMCACVSHDYSLFVCVLCV